MKHSRNKGSSGVQDIPHGIFVNREKSVLFNLTSTLIIRKAMMMAGKISLRDSQVGQCVMVSGWDY
ncbi:hypothetical protein [Photorhabdus heterorhabditis]|uniref:hypothetical protein n=1 Tax=Photorhabdus heterorhabditis TaxID=880156 RepID=UPI001379258C|nr:hypothetical protein [Photorhabdus heterorhabditis]